MGVYKKLLCGKISDGFADIAGITPGSPQSFEYVTRT